MKKYILINGDKGRYTRPIDLYVTETFETLEEASNYLVEHCIYQDEKLKDAIKDCKEYVEVSFNYYHLGYTNNLLTYYSTCDDEYESDAYKIIELEVYKI